MKKYCDLKILKKLTDSKRYFNTQEHYVLHIPNSSDSVSIQDCANEIS